jgi:hypothetical protein
MSNKLDEMMANDVTHQIYHHFCNYMKRWYYKKRNYFSFKTMKNTKRICREFDPSKMVGYAAMQKVRYYEKTYGGIKTTFVDDDMFMGSMLVLIPHKGMGITCIYIPQCVTPQNTFFLYPEHVNDLTKMLTTVKRDLFVKK